MIGGSMKMTSRIALVAAAGFLIGAATPAKAADLGDGCCADLEERVAELEATTARKGNRVVSLQVYGNVSRGLLIWDDGVDSDIYNVDNDNQSTKVGFRGSGLMKPGVTAGFQLEFNIQEADTATVNQLDHDNNDDTGSTAGEFDIRYANVYIEGERLGRLTVGHISEASDGIAQINLGGSGVAGDGATGAGFFVRDTVPATDASNVTWGQLLFDGDGARVNGIRYDSPSLYGFILSTSFSEDDRYDVTLRYSKEWNSVRFAAGVGYRWEEDDLKSLDVVAGGDQDDAETFMASGSVMHVPTGIYISAAYSDREATDFDGFDTDQEHWYVQAGVTRNYFGYGNTTVYAMYGENDFSSESDGAPTINGGATFVDFAETDQWGVGVVQAFDSAATEIYIHYMNYDTDIDAFGEGVDDSTDDFSAVLIGMTVSF